MTPFLNFLYYSIKAIYLQKTKTQVSQLYVSIFNRASEKSGSQNWLNSGYNTDATTMANAMLDTDAAKTYFGTSLDSNAAFVEHIYANTLNKGGADVDAAGKAGWVEFLETGASRGEMVAKMIEAIKEYQVGGAKYATADQATKNAAQQFANRVEVSDYTADTLETIAVSEIDSTLSFSSALTVTSDAATITTAKAAVAKAAEPVGSSFVLKTTQDNEEGTGGNDTFYAYASQNVNGATTNTLSTGDIIDGGKGSSDKIISSMINDETVNSSVDFAPMPIINNVEEIRVQALENTVNGSEVVILDADQITGETKYASDSSRADLVITNVDITSTQITNDIKLEMKDTQQNSDFEVYFDQTSLKANPDKVVSSAQVVIQVADGAQGTGTTAPLANMTFDLSFTQDGKTYSFDNIESTDGTYTGLVTAIQVALAEKGLTQYVVALGDTFSTFTTEAGKSVNLDYTGNYVTITDSEGTAFSDITFAPEQKAGSAVAILLAQSNVNTDAVTTSDVIQSTITLDNVGRGSNGGEVIIGSTSDSKSSTGVERINVIVENSSVVHDISSTNNALKEITLTNGTVKGDFVLTNASYGVAANGGTYSNVKEADFTVGLKSITATDFDGDIVLGRDNDIVNLGMLSAAVNGDVTYNAVLNDNAAHTAVTGLGDDKLMIDLAGSSSVTINTGNGTNTVTLNETTGIATTTAKITGGTGVDTIHGDAVSITVEAGAGNDVIYAENTGGKAVLTLNVSSVINATAATTAGDDANENTGVEFLNNARLKVTLSTNGAAATEAVNGFESALVTITASSGYLTTEADVNNAIVKAINEDTVLNKIATAKIVNGDVQITYLVDGAQVAASVDVEFFGPATPLSSSLQNAIEAEFEDTYNDSGFFGAAGNPVDAAAAQTAAISNMNALVAGALAGGTQAVYTLDLTGTVLTAIGDTLMLDGHVIYTATVAGDTAATIFTAIDGTTVTVNGINYLVGGAAAAVTLTEVVASTDAIVTPGVDGFAVTVSAGTNATDTLADQTTAGIAGTSGSYSVTGADNKNVINGQEGDDFIVLSSEAGQAGVDFDTVVLTNYNQGTDTIIHFETNVDKLDLSFYLNNTLSSSTSEASQVDMGATISNGGNDSGVTLEANSVSVLNFQGGLGTTGFGALLDTAAATVQWDSLTAAQVEAAMENATAGFTTVATANLYQDNAKSIIMIHNNEQVTTLTAPLDTVANAGEYKIFEVSYADATNAVAGTIDFTVKLVGTVDVGANATIDAGDIIA